MTLEYHPLANLFPLIEGEDFDRFVEGFRADGTLHDKIVLLDGQILDGRNRYRACQATEITPHFEQYNAAIHGDPLTYVISKNLHRRHLDDRQRASVAGKIANLKRGRPADAPDDENPPIGGISAEQAGGMMNVAPRQVERARVVHEQGVPELREALDRGDVPVSTAERIARLPINEQADEVMRVLPNGSRAIMGSRQEPKDSLDYFPTPPWAARALLKNVLPYVGVHEIESAWEPACGEGHIAGVLEEHVRGPVIASDIFDYSVDGRSPPAWWRRLDFLDPADAADGTPAVDWIITNPPFGDKGEAFVLRALDLAKVGVAMFFRLQWLESIGRYERIFAAHPPALIAQFAERVPLHKGVWKPDGSTATAYLWIVWCAARRSAVGRTEFIWIPPGRAGAFARPGDVERFTAHPVLPRHDPDTGEIIDSPSDETPDLQVARDVREEAAPTPVEPSQPDNGAASPSSSSGFADDLEIPPHLRRTEAAA